MIDGKIVVHLRAPANTLSGYGVHSRQILDTLLSDDRFIVCYESINWGLCAYIHDDERIGKYHEASIRFHQAKEQKVKFDVSIQVSIPNEFERTGLLNIGVTAGIETDRCSHKWLEKCNLMDFIVVPSNHSKDVLLKTVAAWKNKTTGEEGEFRITKPVEVIPEWFDKKERDPESRISKLSFSTKNNFLVVGQWGDKGGFGEDRKNIADTVRNFYQNFAKDSNAGLILKINLINNSEKDFAQAKKNLSEIKNNFKDAKCKVYLIHDTLSDQEMYDLYQHPQVSAFLTLTHGEGWGLPILEAHSCGLPVLATDWSGHLDFLRKKHGYVGIEYDMVEIPKVQVWPDVLIEGSKWAKFKPEDFKRKAKKFFESPSLIKSQAKENVSWLDENFSRQAVTNKWNEFFDKIIFSKVVKSEEEYNKVTALDALENNSKRLKSLIRESDKEKVLFVMPRSTGDVLMSTAIVDSLIQARHKDSDFYFATLPEYKELFDGFQGVTVIDYVDEMMNNDITSHVFDVVYNPGINVQYNFSNWRLGNGEYAVNIFSEFAKNCNLHPREITNYKVSLKECDIPSENYIVFAPAGTKDAKDYMYWEDVLFNLKTMLPDTLIVQTGTKSERLYDGVLDYRGKSLREIMYVIKHSKMLIGVDSFPAHAAAAVETPHVILYGSTDITVSPTVLGKKTPAFFVLTDDKNGCKNSCFKDSCSNRVDGKNCISNIDANAVCNAVSELVKQINEKEKTEKTQLAQEVVNDQS